MTKVNDNKWDKKDNIQPLKKEGDLETKPIHEPVYDALCDRYSGWKLIAAWIGIIAGICASLWFGAWALSKMFGQIA